MHPFSRACFVLLFYWRPEEKENNAIKNMTGLRSLTTPLIIAKELWVIYFQIHSQWQWGSRHLSTNQTKHWSIAKWLRNRVAVLKVDILWEGKCPVPYFCGYWKEPTNTFGWLVNACYVCYIFLVSSLEKIRVINNLPGTAIKWSPTIYIGESNQSSPNILINK